MAATKKYKVKAHNAVHLGRRNKENKEVFSVFAAGAVVELTDDEAKGALAAGSIELHVEETEKR